MAVRRASSSEGLLLASLKKGAAGLTEKTRVLQAIPPGGFLGTSDVQLSFEGAMLRAPMTAFGAVPPEGATTRSRMAVAKVAGTAEMDPSLGALKAKNFAAFDALAKRASVPGAPQIRVVKFLMTGVDGPNPKMHLINTKTFDNHYPFATDALQWRKSLGQFNGETYFTDRRKNIAGSILFHENYQAANGKKGIYTFEFWPTDQVKEPHVAQVYKALKKALPFASTTLAYHPAGETQEKLLAKEKALYTRARIKTIQSRDLYKNITYAPMNLGSGVGLLRTYDPADPNAHPPSIRDVVILKAAPNDMAHVAGIITEHPQTPLSHENLIAKQNKTPNAYVKNAVDDPRIKKYLTDPPQMVYYEVSPEGLTIREASDDEYKAWLKEVRPKKDQKPPRNLSVKHITKLADISFGDANKFGAKTTNLSELRKILPNTMVPDGYGVPFYFYDRFMKASGLYDAAKTMIADPKFLDDAAYREKALKTFRKKIEKAEMPATLARELNTIQQDFYARLGPDTPIRCRSSTNNEDLPGFNGAGLYDSFTHRPDEGELAKTIKQVYASMWNFKAFDEREFHRIDHFTAAMGVLLHKNEDDEQANGVAYTKHIYDPNWPGFYINAQLGEQLVTNPGAGVTPDTLLISRLGEHGEYETQHITHSTEVPEGSTVLKKADLDKLVSAMEVIQAHFKTLYKKSEDPQFAMDIEFKIRVDGSLQIKQARPTVD